MRAQRHRKTLHERCDTGFGGCVVCLQTPADEGGDGGHADYGAAVALGGHLAGGGLAGVEGTGEVCVYGGGEEVVVESGGGGWVLAIICTSCVTRARFRGV